MIGFKSGEPNGNLVQIVQTIVQSEAWLQSIETKSDDRAVESFAISHGLSS